MSGKTDTAIINSIFRDNYAHDSGGAIYDLATVSISGSEFSNNSAARAGGAVSGFGASLEIKNSSFFNNVVIDSEFGFGGAVLLIHSTATIQHVTFHENRGSFGSLHAQASSTVNMVNSIIAGSKDLACYLSEDSLFVQNTNNWIDDGSCDADHWGDPELSAPRGSPAFIAPYIGSPLIDRLPADGNCLETDQRGASRLLNNACDIGAYEGAIPGPPWQSSWRLLGDCWVTTIAGLSLRIKPEGQALDAVPRGSRLMAFARTDSWIEVVHSGVIGWIHAEYATPAGNCA